MRTILIMGILTIAGCQNVVGPFERTPFSPNSPDVTKLTIEEQERLARDRLALPDQNYIAGPQTGLIRDNPGAGPYRDTPGYVR